MIDRQQRTTARHVVGLVLTIAFALVLSACSVGGDDDSDATATSEAGASTGEPSQTSGTSLPTGAGLSTPIVIGPAGGSPAAQESDSGPEIVVSAPPIEMPTSTPPPTQVPATPIANVATPQVAIPAGGTQGDGTGGANPIPSGTTGESSAGGGGTPVASASPVSVSNRATGCNFIAFPPYSGEDALYLTTVEANFRVGPGQDCDVIGEPLVAGASVEVLSDPVEREGDTEFLWVFVSIDGTQGWLATEVLAPAQP